MPVYRLLGGPYRTELRGYASHWLAGATTPEQTYAGAQEALRRGFTAFKWSPFDPALLRTNEAHAITQAAELMAAARAGAGPDTEIYVECAERLSPRSAVLAAQALLPYRPGWFEEPIPFENPQAMVQLQRAMPVPIATGERLLSRWEVRALLEDGGCQVLQPDVMHAGGITETKRMANLADLSYVPIAPHNPGGPICMLAAMHLAAAIPNFLILEQIEDERELRDQLCTNPVRYREGMFALPTMPGLGTELLLDQLAEHRARPQPTSGSSESLWH